MQCYQKQKQKFNICYLLDLVIFTYLWAVHNSENKYNIYIYSMSQLNLFDNYSSDYQVIHIKNGEYIYMPNFFNLKQSDVYFNKLFTEIKWKQESMKLYGRNIDFPRLTAWYGDIDKQYSFSGITLHPENWTQTLLDIKQPLEAIAETRFNSVLLNLYRNGEDSISWHTDAEKELGENPIIASINFGATRKFQLRHNETKEKIELALSHGSLLIMRGEIQHYWQHQVPKTKHQIKERINLTFRLIK